MLKGKTNLKINSKRLKKQFGRSPQMGIWMTDLDYGSVTISKEILIFAVLDTYVDNIQLKCITHCRRF